MREVHDVPDGLPPLTGSAVACLASILELSAEEVPAPPADHPEPWTVWRNWLAERGLGLVPIANPASFSWPGPWLAILRGEERRVCAVAYGPPSTIAWHPFGGPETFADVEAGYVVAPADVALWSAPERSASRTAGRVEAIAVAAEAEAPIELVDEATAVAGRGLAGDRYHDGRGTFSNPYSVGHDLTLVEAEVLEELGFSPQDARRNVVTRGIDLNALVGRRFRVGDVDCVGRRLCEPCAHLEHLSPGTLRPLVHRGGLRADLLSDGAIRLGDPVSA
jgi:MOSC domain-containing protein YiiM